MIAADTCSLSAYFKGEQGRDVDAIAMAFAATTICIPPVVLTEMLSDPASQVAMLETVADFAVLEVLDGYWHRAGENRRLLKAKGLRCKIADSLVAQSCIDHNVALITRDEDFRHFAAHCGLKLA